MAGPRVALLFSACCVLAACASGPKAGPPPIEIESVRLTAVGHYIDLRYRVNDPKAATEALHVDDKPQLINEATGAVMYVPLTGKLGALRQTRQEQRPDYTYFVMFINSGGLRQGSEVTAKLGKLSFEHLKVQ